MRKLPPSRLAKHRERMIELYQQNNTPAMIAFLFDSSEEAVRRLLVRSGIKLRTRSEAAIIGHQRRTAPPDWPTYEGKV